MITKPLSKNNLKIRSEELRRMYDCYVHNMVTNKPHAILFYCKINYDLLPYFCGDKE